MSARTCFLVALSAAASLAACGDLSNDDLRFLAALPKADEVELRVAPTGNTTMMSSSGLVATSGTQALVGEPAQFYGSASDVAMVVNGGVRRVLTLVANLARASHATARGDGYRVWGPVRNVGGRGITMRFEIREETRADGGPRFVFCLHAARDAEFTPGVPVSCGDLQAAGLRRVLFGHHEPVEGGSGPRAGRGRITVHGDALRAMGDMSIAPGRLDVDFDFAAGGTDKQLHVERLIPGTMTMAARTVTYDYGKVADAVDFHFQFEADVVGGGMTQLETVTLDASWRDGGPGRGDGTVAGGDLQAGDTVTTTECWDAAHLRTYYRLTTPTTTTVEGDLGLCPP